MNGTYTKEGGSTENPGGNTPSGGNGTFTVTGIPSKYNGWWAWVGEGGKLDGSVIIHGAQSIDDFSEQISTGVPVSGGRATIPLWKLNSSQTSATRYSGNDTMYVDVIICPYAVDDDSHIDDGSINFEIGYESVTFSNGSATKAYSESDYSGEFRREK
jgi:hypothetical protein